MHTAKSAAVAAAFLSGLGCGKKLVTVVPESVTFDQSVDRGDALFTLQNEMNSDVYGIVLKLSSNDAGSGEFLIDLPGSSRRPFREGSEISDIIQARCTDDRQGQVAVLFIGRIEAHGKRGIRVSSRIDGGAIVQARVTESSLAPPPQIADIAMLAGVHPPRGLACSNALIGWNVDPNQPGMIVRAIAP